MKLLIVGGVAGGASAATRARRLSESSNIILFERGPDISYANCGLPYFLSGTISQREKLLVSSKEAFKARFNIDVRILTRIDKIDRQKRCVVATDLTSGVSYEETFDRLLLSPGAEPFKPNLPGIDGKQIYTLRTLDDIDRIKLAAMSGIKSATIVGGGFIGLELLENLIQLGLNADVVEHKAQLLPPFDPEMTTPIGEALASNGVRLHLNDSVEEFFDAKGRIGLRLKSGNELATELVILGVGVKPESKLAVEAGLEVGLRGGIKVNKQLQTSDSEIYAVGDAIEVEDFVTGSPSHIPLAGPANRQGRIAANNIFGRNETYRGTQGTAILGIFNKTIATTGASEKALKRVNYKYRKVYVHPLDHAGYYPGAEQMTLKILFDEISGKLLGAQAVGGAGVDKRIDILSIAIQGGLSVYDLEQSELCYAPQFGSAKDPINMAGFVAGGLLRGDHPQISVESYLAVTTEDKPMLLDVRTEKEFAQGSIPGATNIPLDDLRSRLGELPRETPITVYCQVGQRGYFATRILLQNGFQVNNISGGYKSYLLWRSHI